VKIYNMQVEYILNIGIISIIITIIASAITIIGYLCYLYGKAKEKISESLLRNFWKPFLSNGGIIVIPPYPKNRYDFSVKNGTGYNDCIASGEIRKTLASLGKGKAIEVKEKISDDPLNLIVIGGPISNPAFDEVTTQIVSPIVFHYIDQYLFSWDNVPGDDSERLLRYFRNDLNICWVDSAQIHKSNKGHKTIRIFKDENSAEITIHVKEEKATLKISDGRTRNLKVKNENGKLNIYDHKIAHKIIDTVGGKEYLCNEDNWGYGLLYLCKKHCNEMDQTIILIAGCHGSDTRKFGEILTTKEYIGVIMDEWKKQNYVSTVFILRYKKKICTLPNEIVEICRFLEFK